MKLTSTKMIEIIPKISLTINSLEENVKNIKSHSKKARNLLEEDIVKMMMSCNKPKLKTKLNRKKKEEKL